MYILVFLDHTGYYNVTGMFTYFVSLNLRNSKEIQDTQSIYNILLLGVG